MAAISRSQPTMQGRYAKLLSAMLAASLMLAALAGGAVAGPLQDAAAAEKKGDYATALRLVRPLAEQGNAAAQSALGFMYEYAQGVPQDLAAAAQWHRRAAEQGNALSQTRLGFLYVIGVGMRRDYAEAAKWLRLAAQQGRVAAQTELGSLYASGTGVAQDYVAAYMWLSLAAAQGDRDGAETRERIGKFMTPAQIAQAQKMAQDWKPTPQR